MNTWHDLESARDQWIDAPLDDDVLGELLEVAREQVIAYAPTLPTPAEDAPLSLPVSYRRAQLQQARNLWNAAAVNGDGQTGSGDFVFQPRPLDWHIRQLLRPRKGAPRVR